MHTHVHTSAYQGTREMTFLLGEMDPGTGPGYEGNDFFAWRDEPGYKENEKHYQKKEKYKKIVICFKMGSAGSQ